MARPRRFDWLFRPQLAAEDMPLSAETRFAEALADLPAVERSALALSEIGGLDADEIAERLGTDPAVVRKMLARARESVRTTISLRGRRGLSVLIPLQNWWQSGSSAPARAAGAVAAAVVGTGVAIGGASADGPRHPLTNPDPPVVRTLEAPPAREAGSAAAPEIAAAVSRNAEPAPASGAPAPEIPGPAGEAGPAPPSGGPAPPPALPAEPEQGTPAAPPEPPVAAPPGEGGPPEVAAAVPAPAPVDVAVPPLPLPVAVPPVAVPPVALDPPLPPGVPLP